MNKFLEELLLYPTRRTLSALLTDLSLAGAVVCGSIAAYTELSLHKSWPVCPLCVALHPGNTPKQKNEKSENV